MRQSKYTENQIIGIIKAVESGRSVKEVCREHNIGESTYYKWRSKYGGMEASDIRKMKDLEQENQKLKRMFAELALENTALKDVLTKKW